MYTNTIYCEHSLISDVRGDITDILCTAVNLVTSGQAIGAQRDEGIMGNMYP